MAVVEEAVAVAGGFTRTVALPIILAAAAAAAAARVEGTEAAVGTISASRGTATAAVTEAEAVGISKVSSKITWAFWMLYAIVRVVLSPDGKFEVA